MSSLRDLLNEINLLRSNPKEYAEKVLKYQSYFDGNILRIPGTKGGIQTEEDQLHMQKLRIFYCLLNQ